MFTLDFFERWMRNFSYCSMAKMRLGIGLVSRRTLACRAKKGRPEFQVQSFLKSSSEAVRGRRKLVCLPIKRRVPYVLVTYDFWQLISSEDGREHGIPVGNPLVFTVL